MIYYRDPLARTSSSLGIIGDGLNTASESTVSNTELSELLGAH